jgi:hypothetical protein
MMHRVIVAALLVLAGLWPLSAAAQTPITIENPDFEIGAPGDVPGGWTPVNNFFWIGDSDLGAQAGPADGYLSPQFASASWQYGGLPDANSLVGGGTYSASIRQDIDLSPYLEQINQGDLYLGLSYAYFDQDGADIGTISYDFLDSGGVPIGTGYSNQTTSEGGWRFVENLAAAEVPTAASTLRITLLAERNGSFGSARNVAFDAISASLQPPPPPEAPSGLVNGNLIQFNSHGAWSWYMDERAIVDPTNGHVLVSSNVAQGGGITTGRASGAVDVVDFNPATGERDLTQLSDISADDHNAAGLIVLPNGKYLAMYSNHGNQNMGDYLTRYRVTSNPHDASSWVSEQTFNWQTVEGWNEDPYANNRVSYHNLHYLSEEGRVYDFSRGTHQAMNTLLYDPDTNSATWAGQFESSAIPGYGQGYFKFASNGVDRIYFIGTETHPRGYNNSIYAGYLEDGKSYAMDGTELDADIFDNEESNPGATIPDISTFTTVQAADDLGAGYNRLWTADLELGADGNPVALYTSRFNNDTTDHRLHYARYDGSSWHTYDVAYMAERLYGPEEDYTGIGAVVPGKANTIYISTPIDPRDASGNTVTSAHEIYKGVTADGGASWAWSAITENSTVDNLRPIIPNSHGGDTTVIWFRGNYNTAQSIDSAVVGIIDRDDETVGLVDYVDADTGNTTRTNGSPIGATEPSGSAGADDDNWHWRTGFGNDDSVLTSNELGSENAPRLRTTLDGLADGLYDIFAYFWSDNDEDWRLTAGLDENNLINFRMFGSQHAEADQFLAIDTVSANENDLLLYRAYLGRVDVAGGADVEVFIDDWPTSSANYRTWYDGVGYALVTEVIPGLIGDYNDDGIVDAADFTVWRDHLGQMFALPNRDEANMGAVSMADYNSWKANFGQASGDGALSNATVPEPTTLVMLLMGTLAILSHRRAAVS